MLNRQDKDFLVLFVYPNIYSFPGYSPAIGALSAVLKRNGFKTGLVHINNKVIPSVVIEDVAQVILDKNPDLVAFTATSFDIDYVSELVRVLRRKGCVVPVILGGPHATLNSEDFEGSPFDIWCRGDGEIPLLLLAQRLLENKPHHDISGLIVRKDGQLIQNHLETYQDLDQLPHPDRELFDMDKLLALKSGWIEVNAGRGCPFECAYCCNHALKAVYREGMEGPRKCQVRSPERVIDEIRSLVQRYGDRIKSIFFNDELFGLNRAWLGEFLRAYKSEVGIPFSINMRPGLMGEQDLAMLKDACCTEVAVGLESGSDRIRQGVLNRKISREDIRATFLTAKALGLKTLALCMVGIPGEFSEDVMQTIDLLAEIRPRLVRCTIFYPFKGTNLYEHCCRNGYLINRLTIGETQCCRGSSRFHNETVNNGDGIGELGVYSYHEGTVLRLPTITEQEVLTFHRFFGWFINVRINKELSGKYRDAIDRLSSGASLMSPADILSEEASLGGVDAEGREFYKVFERNPYYWALNSLIDR
jgi:anaerobic magnesium-protoporphyrin IX monomethyl ester cyclase